MTAIRPDDLRSLAEMRRLIRATMLSPDDRRRVRWLLQPWLTAGWVAETSAGFELTPAGRQLVGELGDAP